MHIPPEKEFHPAALPFHLAAATVHPADTAIPSGYRRFLPECITSKNLLPPFHPDVSHPEFWPGDVPLSPNVSHPANISGWEKRAFQLPRLGISGPTALTRRVSQPILHSVAGFSLSFPIFAIDIFRYFSLDNLF